MEEYSVVMHPKPATRMAIAITATEALRNLNRLPQSMHHKCCPSISRVASKAVLNASKVAPMTRSITAVRKRSTDGSVSTALAEQVARIRGIVADLTVKRTVGPKRILACNRRLSKRVAGCSWLTYECNDSERTLSRRADFADR